MLDPILTDNHSFKQCCERLTGRASAVAMTVVGHSRRFWLVCRMSGYGVFSEVPVVRSCGMNSRTLNGLPSGRFCRTSRVAFPGLTTGVSSMASSGSCDQEHPGVICRRHPYTTCYNRFVRWRRAGVWGRIIDALAAAHDAAVQMIDTSIVCVHQHGACITRTSANRWVGHAAA